MVFVLLVFDGVPGVELFERPAFGHLHLDAVQHHRGRPVPLGHHREELLETLWDVVHAGVHVDDEGHQDAPGHATQETKLVALNAPALRPEFHQS